MTAGGAPCWNCGIHLDAADVFCTSCGAVASQPSSVTCTTCGTSIGPGIKYCTNCGNEAAATTVLRVPEHDQQPLQPQLYPPPQQQFTAQPASHGRYRDQTPSDRGLTGIWILIGVLAVAAMLAAGWFFGPGVTGEDQSTESAGFGTDEADGADDQGSRRSAEQEAPADTTTTTLPTTTTALPTTTTTGPFATQDSHYGRYVAMLWSEIGSPPAVLDGSSTLETQLVQLRSRFGFNVFAVDSNQFGSLRNGTVGVIYDGGFTSALEAKRWCRANDFPGTQDCFGVVLSDDFTPDQRGDLIRVYEL